MNEWKSNLGHERSPRISIVLPVRNGARWLGDASESIRRQSFPDWELIIVDDGSTDATARIAHSLAESDRRIKALSRSAAGIVSALNDGLSASRSEFVARLDSDDLAHPDRLSCQLSAFEADPELVLLGTWARVIDEAGNMIGRRTPPTSADVIKQMLPVRNPLIHSTTMMRRSAIDVAGGYRIACQGAEDYDLWLRLSEIGKVAILGEDLVDYRVHHSSATSTMPLRQGYAARLARISAVERASGGIDPLAGIDSELDWWAALALADKLAPAALLFRLLDFDSDKARASAEAMPLALPDFNSLGQLSHPEKVLLRRAVVRLAMAPERKRSPRLLHLARAFLATLV